MDSNIEMAKALGRSGGNKTKEKYGISFYKKMGFKSGQVRRERLWKARERGMHTRTEWEKLKKEFGNRCIRCRSKKYVITKDHIIPIYQGGSDSIDNIQPLCRRCNSQKGAENINWVKIRRNEKALKEKSHLTTSGS